MMHVFRVGLAALLMGVGLALSPTALSAPAPRRVTTTGDVLTFVWAPAGDALYLTRAGRAMNVSPRTTQLTGDLYRVALDRPEPELLAENANNVAPAPDDSRVAFARLAENGSAQLLIVDRATHGEQVIAPVEWGSQPRWSARGDRLLYLQGGVAAWQAGGTRAPVMRGPLPRDAVISPRGEIAFVTLEGLWVSAGGAVRRVYETREDERLGFDLAWSNRGDRLAFIVTHAELDPELWQYNLTDLAANRMARGGLEHFANPQWSPDDRFIVWTRVPTGNSTASASEIWRTAANGDLPRPLTDNRFEESAPRYSPDELKIGFLRDGDVWVVELDTNGLASALTGVVAELSAPQPPTGTPQGQRTPPAVVRVRHDAANTCRDAVVGQIDTIDFETYVKRVVPAEVYPVWSPEALMTQAVAARSYAWYYVLQHTGWAYDVTDSTNYQYMCDTRYGSTDAATDATRGQYGAYAGYVIFAAYGAENGDPTLTNNWGNPYLVAVDDPVGFARTRAGNGLGMSQWGAQRWASGFGWNYQQILTHYYTGVTVEAPAGSTPDSGLPVGAVIQPWSNWGIISNRVPLIVNASDDSGQLAGIELKARYYDGANTRDEMIASLGGDGRAFVWNVSGLPDQTGIVVTPHLSDSSGNVFSGNGVRVNLDRKPPQGSVNAPASTLDPNVELELGATDPGGGLSTMAFSNNWVWEGEQQYVEGNSGSVVADAGALNGSALRGLIGSNPPGLWYGPYTDALTAGQAYRAYFRIKTDNVTTTQELARLDAVVDGGDTVLGLRSLHGTDFKTAGAYQEVYVDLYYAGSSSLPLEFRLAYRATGSLWLDRILVVAYPIPYATRARWTLLPGVGERVVIAKFMDAAGNVSEDARATIYLGQAPTPAPTLVPRQWLPWVTR